jgi:hypothetical protein
MKIALTLSALALALAPTLAMAGGGCAGKMHSETASSCLPGYNWDHAAAACVATPST